MYITAQGCRLRNGLYCVEWDVKLYYTILRFNGHFPGGPGLAGTRMSPFWILLQLRVMEVVVTTGAIIRHAETPVKSSPPTDQHPDVVVCLIDGNLYQSIGVLSGV